MSGSITPPAPTFSRDELLRYSRQLIMPEVTVAGQRRLQQARVLCVGAGGLGSPLALYLAAAGVGRLGLVDGDTVDLTNLQRQTLYATADVGRPKLEAARARLSALNPEITVVPHALRLVSANALELLRDYDVIADGSDNFATRYLVNDAAVLLGKPNVSGSVYRFAGQLSVFHPGRGPCYRCLFPEPPPPGLVPSCAESGVLGVLPGIIGSLQALEVLKLLLGQGEPLIGRLLLFDGLGARCRELSFERNPACALCGDAPTIKAPCDHDEARCARPPPSGAGEREAVARYSVEEFHARRLAGEPDALLDVREPHEHQLVSLPGAVLLPLGELPARLHELAATRGYVIYCHRGARAERAYGLLRQAGFSGLRVLTGGIDAWATRIDPSLPRY
ncbi:MAG: molybdopterin-synthase adenylyltransferase MoeB [Proteobacteria bacterium]|nr:molybdopterin-synthase adenylyltransferase MoeB [Pseudomonadota bacterium]